jgi:hypothetical protein
MKLISIAAGSAKAGQALFAQPGSRVRTHCKYHRRGSSRETILMHFEDKLNPTTGYWDQNVYINNVLKSSISTSKFPFPRTELKIPIDLNVTGYGQQGNHFFVSVECASGRCANAPEHSKFNHSSLTDLFLVLTVYRLGRHLTGPEPARS